MKWETGSGFTLLQYQEADLQNCIGLGQNHLWLLKFCQTSPIEFNLRNQNQGDRIINFCAALKGLHSNSIASFLQHFLNTDVLLHINST